MDDSRYMKRALSLARRGIGKTSPNPAVGCVIVRDGQVVGEGWHRRAGTPHAEIHALNMAGEMARNSDLYVTLEPCCHQGKTPPCTDALIRAGVRRVVAGMVDPNPLVAGKGLTALRDAGIIVECGLLEQQCRELNPGFIKFATTGLPHVIYKTAMTLDGVIATITGHSRWVTGDEARTQVHRLRSRCDAVMVGVDTVISDNPQLTVRHVKGRNPVRVVVDTRLRTPESVAVLSDSRAQDTIIATCESNSRVHRRYLLQGAHILVCEERNGRVSLPDMLHKLGERGIRTVLLEGGSRLAGEMVQAGLIDEFMLFYAPKIVGNDGFSAFALQGVTTMDHAIRLKILDVRMFGPDLLVHAVPEVPCSPA